MFDLRLDIHGEGQDVRGDRLWRLAVWASDRRDGLGERFGIQPQVIYGQMNAISSAYSQKSFVCTHLLW